MQDPENRGPGVIKGQQIQGLENEGPNIQARNTRWYYKFRLCSFRSCIFQCPHQMKLSINCQFVIGTKNTVKTE